VTSETQEDNFRVVIYDRGIMAGMDLSVNLTDHIAVVPQVRLVSAAYGWNVRPGVSLRWRP
jgi:hypothetical protein